MAIFELQDGKFNSLKKIDFGTENILETNIQDAVKDNIDVIASDCIIIAKEFSQWNDSNRRIDLLAVDKKANLVVIELKRKDGRDMELQSLRYAAMVSTLTYEDAVKTYEKYLESIGSNSNDAENNLLNHFGWEDTPKEDKFALNVRIILVSEDFSSELATTVLWLNEITSETIPKITCIRLIPYKYEDKIFIAPQQIIPLPEAKDYQTKLNIQLKERKKTQSERDYTKFIFEENTYAKNQLVLAVIQKYVKDNPPPDINNLHRTFNRSPDRKNLFAEYDSMSDQTKKSHFCKDNELLEGFSNGKKYAVYRHHEGDMTWIKEIAEQLGYNIETIKED